MLYTLRIKKSKNLKYVLKRGKYCNKRNIVVHCLRNKNIKDKNYFAVCISKKNGNSVQRNKLKRWGREIYKNEEIYLKRGYNIIILYKKTTHFLDINFKVIKNEILECFEELDLYEK